jgi:hypothetical protein
MLVRRRLLRRAAGITCRWARSHANPDALSAAHLTPAAGAAPAVGPPPAVQAAAVKVAVAAPEGDAWWWRQDGTLPASVELPVAAALPPSLNNLSQELKISLRCGNAHGVCAVL